MLLQVKNLKKSYNKRTILSDFSFYVQSGEVVGLLGPNGAGKTTAFYLTMGLIRPDSGEILFDDHNISKLSIDQRAKIGMGYLSQEPSIFRSLSVEDNIKCILQLVEKDETKHPKIIKELLDELSLSHLAKKNASTLSGGERRRLEITRALVTKPKLLLLDEPFANIDPLTIEDVKKMILHLKNKGISVLITDHNAREIFTIVDRSYLLHDGKTLLSGTPKELTKSSLAQKYYLGDNFTY